MLWKFSTDPVKTRLKVFLFYIIIVTFKFSILSPTVEGMRGVYDRNRRVPFIQRKNCSDRAPLESNRASMWGYFDVIPVGSNYR